MPRHVLDESKIHPAIRERVARHHESTVQEVRDALVAHPVVVVGMRQNAVVRKARQALAEAGIAFQAQDRAMVDAFYQAAMAHGGRDNGAPGERAYHPGYYAAFVLDPDGNNIEAVFHGETVRSAPSVRIAC